MCAAVGCRWRMLLHDTFQSHPTRSDSQLHVAVSVASINPQQPDWCTSWHAVVLRWCGLHASIQVRLCYRCHWLHWKSRCRKVIAWESGYCGSLHPDSRSVFSLLLSTHIFVTPFPLPCRQAPVGPVHCAGLSVPAL